MHAGAQTPGGAFDDKHIDEANDPHGGRSFRTWRAGAEAAMTRQPPPCMQGMLSGLKKPAQRARADSGAAGSSTGTPASRSTRKALVVSTTPWRSR